MRIYFASRHLWSDAYRSPARSGSRDNSHEDEAFTEGKVQEIVNRCRKWQAAYKFTQGKQLYREYYYAK